MNKFVSQVCLIALVVLGVIALPETALSQFTPQRGEDPMQIWLNDPIGATLRAYTEAADEVRGNPSPEVTLAHLQE